MPLTLLIYIAVLHCIKPSLIMCWLSFHKKVGGVFGDWPKGWTEGDEHCSWCSLCASGSRNSELTVGFFCWPVTSLTGSSFFSAVGGRSLTLSYLRDNDVTGHTFVHIKERLYKRWLDYTYPNVLWKRVFCFLGLMVSLSKRLYKWLVNVVTWNTSK